MVLNSSLTPPPRIAVFQDSRKEKEGKDRKKRKRKEKEGKRRKRKEKEGKGRKRQEGMKR